MPIDARIPLMGHKPDPNGFVNALAAGMKMRRYQDEADAAAYKDEMAQREANALSAYGKSPRGQTDRDALWAASPKTAMGIEKNTSEAQYHEARTQKLQADWAKANHGLLAEASGAILANPTRENANMVLDGLEAQGGDMSRPRKQLETAPDQAIVTLAKGWAGNAQKVQQMALAEEKAKPKPRWNSYTGSYVDPPTTGGPQAGPEAAPYASAPAGRAPTMVPGGDSGYSHEELLAEQERRARGGGPSEAFNMSDESFGQLLQAQTDQENAKAGGAAPPTDVDPTSAGMALALPVDGEPAPMGGPQAPPASPSLGPPRSPSEAAQRAADQRAARAIESDRLATERQEKGFAHAEKMAEEARAAKAAAAEARRTQPTAQTAAKSREKLQTLDIIDAQLDKVEAAFMGEKGPDGSRSGGIENSFSAGYGVGGYLPTEGGRSFDAAIDGLRPFLRQVSRTPGEGAMSDYETKQAEALLPSRNDHESVTKQKIQQLRDISKQSRSSLTAPVLATPQTDRPAPTPVKVGATPPDYTYKDLEYTASKNGISIAEVKRRLGIR